ncbi:hypothetical protein ACRAWD_12500 [Caulobacter segnis]
MARHRWRPGASTDALRSDKLFRPGQQAQGRAFRVGAEHEKFGFYLEARTRPCAYEGDRVSTPC